MSVPFYRIIGTLLATVLLSAATFAESISINFVGGRTTPCCGGGGSASVTGAAGFSVSSNWNNFSSNTGSGLPLVDSTGGSNGATLTYNAPNKLSNSGENVKLSFALGSAVHEFTYFDRAPWPGAADGFGPSMELVSHINRPDHALAISWQASAGNGSPGGTNTGTVFVGTPDADADNDGLAALLEFALGTSDAVTNDVSDAYTYAVESFDGSDHATFTYQRNLAARDIGIIVEISKDLVTWETAPEQLLEREVPSGSDTSLITWRSRDPLDRVCYFRLRIVQF